MQHFALRDMATATMMHVTVAVPDPKFKALAGLLMSHHDSEHLSVAA